MKRLGQKGRAYAHEKGARTEQRSKDRTKEQGQNKGARTEQRSKDRTKEQGQKKAAVMIFDEHS